jgi:hypothetical protein
MAMNDQAVTGGAFERVLWIGGAPDSGKTTIARALAAAHGLALYEYDRRDLAHHQALSVAHPDIAEFLHEPLDERWNLEAQLLAERAMLSFQRRFPLVTEEVAALARAGRWVVAEGFGLTPNLVGPLLNDPARALFLVPTPVFKRASWTARDKPSFKRRLADPAGVERRILERDARLADAVRAQAAAWGLRLIEVDDQVLPTLLAEVEAAFGPYL